MIFICTYTGRKIGETFAFYSSRNFIERKDMGEVSRFGFPKNYIDGFMGRRMTLEIEWKEAEEIVRS